MMQAMTPATPTSSQPDSRQAVLRLLVTLALMAVGASGMFVVPVVLPAVQAEFGVARADASLPYTALMIGFGVGGLLMGRLADRRGAIWPPIVQHFIETVGWRQTYVAWVCFAA